ncbi:MAG: hypothetical protein ACR2RE_11235 [Geminicoccaceae bacterium]
MATKKQELPPQTSDKAMAAGIGGAIVTLALWFLAPWFGIEPPASADVQLSIQTLIDVLVMMAVGGLVPAGAAWGKRNWQKPVDPGD